MRTFSPLLMAALTLCAPYALAAKADKKSSTNLFIGHYGYTIEYPSSYTAFADFDDPEKTFEVVFFYPRGLKQEQLRNEKGYETSGVIRVEVAPILHHGADGDHRMDLKALRRGIPVSLKKNGETFTVKDYPLSLPAFRVDITKPRPLLQIVIEGRKVTYIVTAGSRNRVISALLKSLHEEESAGSPGR